MSLAFMRNRRTTELTAVELDGEEFRAMRAEVGPDGRPVWEQTSDANALEQKARIDAGTPRDEDIGDDDQPVERVMDTGDPIEVRDTRNEPTPGEIANDIGPDDRPGPAGESGTGYEDQTVAELKDQLARRDLAVSGTKEELVDRLEDDDSRRSEEPEQPPALENAEQE